MATFSKIKSGDVLQFSTVTTVTTYPFRNGYSLGWSNPQQSAIVYKNLGNGQLLLLEHNRHDQQFVNLNRVNLSGMISGAVQAYKPKVAVYTVSGPARVVVAGSPEDQAAHAPTPDQAGICDTARSSSGVAVPKPKNSR